jgi:hypothetical protein
MYISDIDVSSLRKTVIILQNEWLALAKLRMHTGVEGLTADMNQLETLTNHLLSTAEEWDKLKGKKT